MWKFSALKKMQTGPSVMRYAASYYSVFLDVNKAT